VVSFESCNITPSTFRTEPVTDPSHAQTGCYSSEEGSQSILVSSGPFWEICICTNTPKYSLFDAQKNAENNPRVLELLHIICWVYQEEGCQYISVSSGSFWKICICTNTPKYSLFDAQKNAENNPHVLELLHIICWGYQEEGCQYISVSSGPFWEIYICTNTPKYSLFDAQKNVENDKRVLELLHIILYHFD